MKCEILLFLRNTYLFLIFSESVWDCINWVKLRKLIFKCGVCNSHLGDQLLLILSTYKIKIPIPTSLCSRVQMGNRFSSKEFNWREFNSVATYKGVGKIKGTNTACWGRGSSNRQKPYYHESWKKRVGTGTSRVKRHGRNKYPILSLSLPTSWVLLCLPLARSIHKTNVKEPMWYRLCGERTENDYREQRE